MTGLPAAPTAAAGVEVRLISLEVPDEEVARLCTLLTLEELQRGNRLLDKGRRDTFFTARGMLREMLGDRVGEKAASLALTEGEFGKLELRDHPGATFNLSHAGGYLAVALTQEARVGIDLEPVRQELAYRPMAERYFSVREREELFALSQEEQLESFYRCWTRKEAYMKGTGTGFSQPSTAFDVSLLPHQPPALLAHRRDPAEPKRWSILDVEAPSGFCVALAVEELSR